MTYSGGHHTFHAATTGRKSQALYSTPEEFTFELGEDGEMRNVNTPVKEEAPVPSSEDETPKESQVAMLGVPLPLRFYPLCGTCFASRHPKFRAPFTPGRNPSCPQLATTEWSIMHQKSCLSAWPIIRPKRTPHPLKRATFRRQQHNMGIRLLCSPLLKVHPACSIVY